MILEPEPLDALRLTVEGGGSDRSNALLFEAQDLLSTFTTLALDPVVRWSNAIQQHNSSGRFQDPLRSLERLLELLDTELPVPVLEAGMEDADRDSQTPTTANLPILLRRRLVDSTLVFFTEKVRSPPAFLSPSFFIMPCFLAPALTVVCSLLL